MYYILPDCSSFPELFYTFLSIKSHFLIFLQHVLLSNFHFFDRLVESGCCHSVVQSCSALCNPMGAACQASLSFTVFPEFVQFMFIESMIPSSISSSVVPSSSCLQSFPASGSFPMSQLFASGGQSTGASASASII